MDLKLVINALIIVAILHLVLTNLDFSMSIGNKKENFSNTLEFLDNNDTETKDIKDDEELRESLVDYVKSQHFNIANKATDIEKVKKVVPGNFYEEKNNTPNFESNVTDVSNFYENNFDNLNAEDLPTVNDQKNLQLNNQCIDGISKQAMVVNREASQPTIQPDVWTYKNELPMNGGKMNGIVGFDSLDSQYAVYDTSSLNVQSCKDNGMVAYPKNDLRKPDVIN